MTLIYQVGRLRGEKVKFSIEDPQDRFKIESELSSFALKEYFKSKGETVEVVLVYPVSLVLKETEKSTKEDFLQRLKNPKEHIEDSPLEKERDRALIIHSIGTYGSIDLNGQYGDIVLELFFDMVKNFLSSKPKGIYLDISSGYNVYPVAMVEAANHLSTFTRLICWPEESYPQIFTTFSDPILGREGAREYEIHIEKQLYKIPFDSPLVSFFKRSGETEGLKNWLKKASKGVYNDSDEQQAKALGSSLEEKLKESLLIYSSIINSLPLCACYLKRSEPSEIENEIEKFIENAERKLFSDYQSSPKLDKELHVAIVCQLGMYVGMVNMFEKYGLSHLEPERIDLNRLSEAFQKILSSTGQNKMLLMNEIDYFAKLIAEYLNGENARLGEWTDMAEIVEPGSKLGEPHERNFFAHIGLERNITQVMLSESLNEKKSSIEELREFIKKTPNTVYVRYRDFQSLRKKLESWLMKNV